ncbi:hypothetical protein GGD55_002464 [Rhizobium giardinii]|uniref:Uncharacterized protein n=1 Tax=Rhizobium giardinii TaxID=56731 RepID=A0A7W8X702_9HYPH|nr:hypothetical protein [Rhizobium giardinii]
MQTRHSAPCRPPPGWPDPVREAGDRDETSAFDTEPSRPMRKTELAHVGRAAVCLHADQFFEIERLALRRKLLGFRFGRLLDPEAPGRAVPSAHGPTVSSRQWYCGRSAPSDRGSSGKPASG